MRPVPAALPLAAALIASIAPPLPAAAPPTTLAPAESLFAEGRFAAADSLYARTLARDPGDTLAILRRGTIALYENRLADARALLRRAVRQAPADPRRHSLLAEAHYRADRFPAAARELRAAGRETKARMLEDFGDRRPRRIEGDSTEVPFLQTDPLPVIEASVNGSAPVKLIIDTGGAELILDPRFADSVGVRRFGQETGLYAGDRTASFERGRADSVRIGRLVVRDVPVDVQSTRQYAAAARGERIDGIVGTTFLSRFLATLDFPRGRLVLRARGSEAAKAFQAQAEAERRIVVPFWLAGDHFMVAWGTLNGGPPRLWFVDTGLAGGGFTCPRSTLEEAGVDLGGSPEVEGVGGGGKVKVVPFVAERLTLGEAEVRKVFSFFGPFPETLERRFGFRIAGLVAHTFFRGFALSFDFERMRLYLAPGS